MDNADQIHHYNESSFSWVKGKIYLTNGEIKSVYLDPSVIRSITYKTEPKGEPEKIKLSEVEAWIEADDSVFQSSDLKKFFKGKPIEITGRHEVNEIVSFPWLNAYRAHKRTAPFTYVFLTNEENKELIEVPNNKKDFKEYVTPFFKEVPELQAKIRDGSYDFKNMKSLIMTYYEYYKLKNGLKTYYDKSWTEKTKAKEGNYSITESLIDSTWTISYYLADHTKVLTAKYSSLFPTRKNGTFTWYYPSGQVRKEVNYLNNDPNGEFKEYHANGKIAKTYELDEDKKIKIIEIRDIQGNSLVTNGNGTITLNDSLGFIARQIERKYSDGYLEYSKVTEGNTVYYQASDSPKKIKKTYDNLVSFKVPSALTDSAIHKLIFVRALFMANGSNHFTVLNTNIPEELNKEVLRFMSDCSLSGGDAQHGKQKVDTEILFVFSTSQKSNSTRNLNNYYYNWQHMHQMMQQQFQQMNMQHIQSVAPRF